MTSRTAGEAAWRMVALTADSTDSTRYSGGAVMATLPLIERWKAAL